MRSPAPESSVSSTATEAPVRSVSTPVFASPAGRAGTGQFGASLTAVTFMTLAVLALIWGGVHLMVGTLVRRRRHWSRHAALMLGTVDLLLLPYGTALGVYSLWILLREDAKRMFETAEASFTGPA